MPPAKATPPPQPADETTAAPEAPQAAVASPGPADPGGVFVNVSGTALEIPFTGIPATPAASVKPGRVVDLGYTPTHRDLKPATPADLAASAALDAAEATTGQES